MTTVISDKKEIWSDAFETAKEEFGNDEDAKNYADAFLELCNEGGITLMSDGTVINNNHPRTEQ